VSVPACVVRFAVVLWYGMTVGVVLCCGVSSTGNFLSVIAFGAPGKVLKCFAETDDGVCPERRSFLPEADVLFTFTCLQ